MQRLSRGDAARRMPARLQTLSRATAGTGRPRQRSTRSRPCRRADSAIPNELYTEAVKIVADRRDAQVQRRPRSSAPSEWLTVAARDAQGPPTPGQPDDASTILIRIKGSDLTAFHVGQAAPAKKC